MFDFIKRHRFKIKFDRKILRKNDISLLILDERWNGLFANIDKTSEMMTCEEKIKDLLKQQSRMNEESGSISTLKKGYMNKIIQLTPEVFDKNDEEAKKEMKFCETEIKRINERLAEIEKELEKIPDSIKDKNIELLELTVNLVYFRIRSSQRRVRELDALIEETREKLKGYIDEKETLSQDNTDIYSYFHDLLGGEEMEKMDRKFFK